MLGKENIEEIIYRHLNNETSADDEKELKDWLDESQENRDEFDELQKIWNESAGLANGLLFNKEAAWKLVEEKTGSTSGTGNKPQKIIWLKYLRIAAAVILFVSATVVVYYYAYRKNSSFINITASDGNKKIKLPDSTDITLRQGSNLIYSRDYGKLNREVHLSGEAYFEVTHDPAFPFRIYTNKTVIEEIGTSFLAISSNNTEQVFVSSGTLKIHKKDDSSSSIIIAKGQSSSLVGKVFEKDSITDDNYLFWKSGELRFENLSLKKMIAELNEYFKSNIKLSDELAAKSDTIKVNFRFENNSLSEVLDEIHLTTGLLVEKENAGIILRDK